MMMETSKFESFIADGDTASPKKYKSEEKLIIKKEKSVSRNDNKLNRRKSARELKQQNDKNKKKTFNKNIKNIKWRSTRDLGKEN